MFNTQELDAICDQIQKLQNDKYRLGQQLDRTIQKIRDLKMEFMYAGAPERAYSITGQLMMLEVEKKQFESLISAFPDKIADLQSKLKRLSISSHVQG